MSFLSIVPWKRLMKVGKPFWTSEMRRTGLIHVAIILSLMAANASLNVFIGATTGRFMTALSQRSILEFWHFLGIWVCSILAAIPVQTYYGYFRTRLALIWRNWLSNHIFGQYFHNFAFYKLVSNKELDNPDQRMTQDVDSFCNTSVGLFVTVVDAAVTISAFTVVLWKLMPPLPVTVLGYTPATSMAVLCMCKLILPFSVLTYSAFGSVLVVYIGKALPGLNFQQMKTEADLRFGLSEVRREADTIALTGAAALAKAHAERNLGRVIAVLFGIMTLERNVAFFTTPYNMLMTLIPTSIMGYLYVIGVVPFGSIAQATIAFSAIFGGATLLIGQFSGVMAYRTTIERVGAMLEAVEAAGVKSINRNERIEVYDGDSVKYEHLTVMSPDGSRTLINDLSLEVANGSSLLITGDHGVGKTAMLRVTAGYYDRGSGALQRPVLGQIMFLTASPYLPPVTLRQALCYSFDGLCDDETKLSQALGLAKLSDLPDRAQGFDAIQTWHELLTQSELQRLSLARVLLARPEYVVIDDGANALQDPDKQLFYTLLLNNHGSVISAGPPSLAQYHKQVLELRANGSWELRRTNELASKLTSRNGAGGSAAISLTQK